MKITSKIETYSNSNIALHHSKAHNFPRALSEEIFIETKKWLLLSHINRLKGNERLFIHGSLSILDDMWHTFILFTRDYEDFCNNYVGGFIHHEPSVSPNEITPVQIERQMSMIYDTLGADTLSNWYEFLPQSVEKLKI